MKFAPETPVELLREYLSYDPKTGIVRWIKWRGSRTVIGAQAGTPKKPGDYLIFQIDGVLYRAHRVAWAMHYGVWPPDEIDHKNRNRQDNRIDNLRLATRSKNAANGPSHIRGRLKGTGTMPSGRWTAQLGFNRKKLHLGCFDTEREAHEAYCVAAKKYFGDHHSTQ